MLVIDDLLLGVLASALVAYADRLDGKAEEEAEERRKALREAAERMRSPQLKAEGLLNEAVRHEDRAGRLEGKVAEVIAGNSEWGYRLAQWILEADPTASEATHRELTAQLAEASGSPESEIEAILSGAAERIYAHPELSRLRADKKLNAILTQLGELETLRLAVERQPLYTARILRNLLKEERQRHLVPVIPQPRPPRRGNALLGGARPRAEDMDEDIDFRRRRFPEVMQAIQDTEELPAAFIFLAEPERGKTTFLKRVGWELAKKGYPVLELEEGANQEPYAGWIAEAAEQFHDLPLIVLIDDPAGTGDHFINQMNTVYDRKLGLICLIASRKKDWEHVQNNRGSLLRSGLKYDLDPTASEAESLLDKLIETEVVQIDPERREQLLDEIQGIPTSGPYFHAIIRLASDDQYLPIPVLVEKALQEANGSAESQAFEKLYGLVCAFGMVGLPTPRAILRSFFNSDNEFKARSFSNRLVNSPIRWEKEFLIYSHEEHAAAFFEARDLSVPVIEIARKSLNTPDLRNELGWLLALFHLRGHIKLAENAWHSIEEDVDEGYWEKIDPESATHGWGRFFFECSRFGDALNALEIGEIGEDPTLSASALFNRGLVLEKLERFLEAVESYSRGVAKLEGREEPHVLEAIARALASKATDLTKLEQHEQVIATCEDLIQRLQRQTELPLSKFVAGALIDKAVALGQLGAARQACATYDQLINRFEDHNETPLLEKVSKALFNKAVTLSDMGENQQAAEIYEKIIRKFKNHEEPSILEQVAKALSNKAIILAELGKTEQAIDTLDKLFYQFKEREETSLVSLALHGLFNKAIALLRADQTGKALSVFDDLLRRLENQAETPTLALVAQTLLNKARVLTELGEPQQAIDSYNELVRRFEGLDERPLLEWVAKALVNKAIALAKLGETQQAIDTYDRLLELSENRYEITLLERVATALVNKAANLAELGKSKQAIDTYDELICRFKKRDEINLLEPVARALIGKATTLIELGENQQAIATYNELLRRFEDRDEIPLLEQVAQAHFDKARTLTQLIENQAFPEERGNCFRQAQIALARCSQLTAQPLESIYNYACLLALQGEHEAALTSLDICFQGGTADCEHVATDPDWDDLRDSEAFQAIIAKHCPEPPDQA